MKLFFQVDFIENIDLMNLADVTQKSSIYTAEFRPLVNHVKAFFFIRRHFNFATCIALEAIGYVITRLDS